MAKRTFAGPLLALSAGIMWSFGSVTVRFATEADVFQYLLWRCAGLVVAMEIIALMMSGRLILPRLLKLDRLDIAVAVSILTASFMYIFAVKTTTVANAVFYSSTAPLHAAILGRIVLGERIGPAGTAAVVLALIGIAVMGWGDFGAGNLIGNLAALFCAFSFATYSVLIRLRSDRDWMPALVAYALLGIVISAVMTSVNGRNLMLPPLDLSLALVHGAVLIGIGTMLFNYAARVVPAVGLTVLVQSEMIFAPLWVYLLLNEVPRVATMIGGGIILAAILVRATAASPAVLPVKAAT